MDNILFLLMVASAFGFYLWFWTRSGQTLGMIAWQIRVESLDGGLISRAQGLIRFLAAWSSFFMLGLGFVWLYIDSRGDTVHDELSSSRVVLLPKSHKPF